MLQRAILENENDVLAYNTDDDIWSGLTAAYKANRLTLPCCGAHAIPKQHLHGTRYVPHPPYNRKECDWKDVLARHEAIVAEVASMINAEEWYVQTEA